MVAFMYTLIVSAKMNDIDPHAWLADVLKRLPDMPVSLVSELLPWNATEASMTSPKHFSLYFLFGLNGTLAFDLMFFQGGSMLRLSVSVFLLLSIAACKEEDKFDAGYDDGFATGYNTACEIRATLIEGDWDSPTYSRGYNEGNSAGVIECNRCRDKRPSADCP